MSQLHKQLKSYINCHLKATQPLQWHAKSPVPVTCQLQQALLHWLALMLMCQL